MAKSDTYWELVVIVFLLLLAGGAYAAYGEWAYDDWTCAFKNCRVVK